MAAKHWKSILWKIVNALLYLALSVASIVLRQLYIPNVASTLGYTGSSAIWINLLIDQPLNIMTMLIIRTIPVGKTGKGWKRTLLKFGFYTLNIFAITLISWKQAWWTIAIAGFYFLVVTVSMIVRFVRFRKKWKQKKQLYAQKVQALKTRFVTNSGFNGAGFKDQVIGIKEGLEQQQNLVDGTVLSTDDTEAR